MSTNMTTSNINMTSESKQLPEGDQFIWNMEVEKLVKRYEDQVELLKQKHEETMATLKREHEREVIDYRSDNNDLRASMNE